jgi:hypothetical protein
VKLDLVAGELQERLRTQFPDITVRLDKWERDPARVAIYFVTPSFANLYPLQRYHYIAPLLPDEYMSSKGLANAVWFELAPGEQSSDIEHPDDELIKNIAPDVLAVLRGVGYFEDLDDVLCPSAEQVAKKCAGNFEFSKALLRGKGISEADFGDIFNVLMHQGAFCDCEVLYNVAEESRLKSYYWDARHEQS